MKLLYKFTLLLALLSLTTISHAQKGGGGTGNTGDCTKSCPNYPCCLEPNVDCDDTPCNQDPTGGGSTGGGYSGSDRPVVWIHGMEGSTGSWKRYYNDYVQKYKIFNVIPGYSSANGAVSSANSVNQQINSALSSAQQANTSKFVIAHSMGGLVARTMEMQSQGGFGGFVTVGTPHAGARTALAAQNGEIDAFIQLGIQELSKGPIEENLPFPIMGGYLSKKAGEFLTSKARSAIEQFGKPGAIATLSPTGGLIAQLNNQPINNKPKIAFAGAETTPTLWREVESLINSPSDLNPDEESDAFIPNVVIEGFKDKYMDKYLSNKTKAMGASVLFYKKRYVRRANAWIDGYIWLDQSNGRWQVIIGAATGSTSKTINILEIIHNGFCDNEVKETQKTYTVITNGPNDGIVVEASALAFPGANYTETLLGVNHQQCMNHANVTQALTSKVFDGGGHAFFTCQKR